MPWCSHKKDLDLKSNHVKNNLGGKAGVEDIRGEGVGTLQEVKAG